MSLGERNATSLQRKRPTAETVQHRSKHGKERDGSFIDEDSRISRTQNGRGSVPGRHSGLLREWEPVRAMLLPVVSGSVPRVREAPAAGNELPTGKIASGLSESRVLASDDEGARKSRERGDQGSAHQVHLLHAVYHRRRDQDHRGVSFCSPFECSQISHGKCSILVAYHLDIAPPSVQHYFFDVSHRLCIQPRPFSWFPTTACSAAWWPFSTPFFPIRIHIRTAFRLGLPRGRSRSPTLSRWIPSTSTPSTSAFPSTFRTGASCRSGISSDWSRTKPS